MTIVGSVRMHVVFVTAVMVSIGTTASSLATPAGPGGSTTVRLLTDVRMASVPMSETSTLSCLLYPGSCEGSAGP